jgi:hypothetical protein
MLLDSKQQGAALLGPETDGDSIDTENEEKSMVGVVSSSPSEGVAQEESAGDCHVISHWIAAIPD